MNLKGIANFVTSKVGRRALVLQKHSPRIMFVAGVVGVGATVVLACRATLKVDSVLQEHEKTVARIKLARKTIDIDNNVHHYTDTDERRDMAVLYTKTTLEMLKLYGPSVIIGVASIALLTSAHFALSRRNVGLMAAYAALDKGYNEYRQRVSDEYGPDKELELRHGLVDEEVTDEQGNKKVVKVHPNGRHGSIYARCWDEFSTSYTPEDQGGAIYNPIFLRTQQQYANDLLRARGHVLLNDVYDMLGIPRSREGAIVGWVLGAGDDYIDFGVFENDEFTAMQFVQGRAPGIWLDFNVDGVVYDKI
jgi:hypothetical protein